MSLAAKWKNRASGGACGGEVVRPIFPISPKYPLKPNSGDCGDIAHKNPPPALSTDGGPSGLPMSLCLGCGKRFTPSDPNKVFCRARCFNTMRGVLQ